MIDFLIFNNLQTGTEPLSRKPVKSSPEAFDGNGNTVHIVNKSRQVKNDFLILKAIPSILARIWYR